MTRTRGATRPDGTTIDKEALRRRYRAERDKRLRPDGNDQYVRPTDELARYLADPWTPVVERDPVTDHVTVAVIGGGFAGLVTAARLKEAGVADVRLVEKGGDVGGTWYWNRYPGAQCDTASLVYLPLLEETGYMPSEKYAHGPEILEHCQRIAKHYGVYDGALLSTEVQAVTWDATRSVWVVRTDRGDAFSAQFVTMGIGLLHVPKLPGIPGIASFRGRSFHTSRWAYAYTGGDPFGAPLDRLADQRVALIGTGATAVQCVPHLARACRELFVFQRAPSSVDVRDNAPLDPEWFAGIATHGWQQRWLENFTANQAGGAAAEDLVMDGWTDLARRIRTRILALPPEQLTAEGMLAAFEDSDAEKMEQIRARVDAVVHDPATAAALKAWYRQQCKRPCFPDEYLQAYNEPSTHLVHTDGKGVERITETAVVAAGTAYDVDCIVFASGFEVGTDYTRRAGFEVIGRAGVTLSQRWAEGMRSLRGIHVQCRPDRLVGPPAVRPRLSDRRSGGDVDAHCQGDRVAADHVSARHAELQCARVLAEDEVVAQADLRQPRRRPLVSLLLVHRLAHVLRQRDLRGGDCRGAVGHPGLIGIDLEMDVRPATGVAGREDGGEAHPPPGVGDLHTAEVVLVCGALAVERVAGLAVALPDVHGGACEGHAAVGEVTDDQLELHRDAVSRTGVVAEAGADVAAYDAAVREDVRPVGAVGGEGAGRLVRDLLRRRRSGRARRGRRAPAVACGRRGRRAVACARRDPECRRTDAQAAKRLAAAEQRAQVEAEPLVGQLVVRTRERAPFVGRSTASGHVRLHVRSGPHPAARCTRLLNRLSPACARPVCRHVVTRPRPAARPASTSRPAGPRRSRSAVSPAGIAEAPPEPAGSAGTTRARRPRRRRGMPPPARTRSGRRGCATSRTTGSRPPRASPR
jgi:cation diffusion facilitator CzcD-associated flavoprotein CzcO